MIDFIEYVLQVALVLVLVALLCAWVALVIFVSFLLGPLGWIVGPFVLLMTLGVFAR